VPELRDADLLHRIAGALQGVLQGLVGAALAQPLQEPPLAVGHVKKVLPVGGDQDEAELGGGLQVRDVSVEESRRVELRQADGRPAFAVSEARGGAHEVEDQVQVDVVQDLVLLPHQGHQAVARQQDGEHQALGFGGLQARRHRVPGGAGQGQAGDGAEQQARVSVQPVQQAVGEVLGAGQQAAQVEVLLVPEDVVELRERQQADDLVVDVLQLPQQLLVRLRGPRHAHQDQGALDEEDHLTAV